MSKSFASLVALFVIGSNTVFAQSVDQGKKFYYYQRYKSAKETFEKVLAANPNDINAVYWLGETLLLQRDSVAAKNLYQKSLTQNGNAPILLAGMGQVELMDGKTNDARQRFETAISLTKGKDVDVLNAIGRANVMARSGDVPYAVEKLIMATNVKGFKDPETYMLMGDAYRRLIDGGNAVTSYNKALSLDPKLAAAKYAIGKVYLTQNNKEFFLQYFDEAIALDPAYAPVYNELFYYYYNRDINKAKDYLDKYVANTDQGPELEYMKTYTTYSSGDFATARTRAQALITQYGTAVAPRMYRMVAYTSDTLGDMANAKQAMNTFLSKADSVDVLPADYEELANIASKTPGSEMEAFASLQKAIDKDSLMDDKVKFANKGVALAKKLNNKQLQSDWALISYNLKKNPSNADLYNLGYTNYQAGNYKIADSLFCNVYIAKYPNEIFGYLWCAKSKVAQDDSLSSGALAEGAYLNLLDAATKQDTAKYRKFILESLFYLAGVSNNVKKDKEAAIGYLEKILAIDPTNPTALQYIEILKKANKQPKQQPKNGTATKSGSPPPKR